MQLILSIFLDLLKKQSIQEPGKEREAWRCVQPSLEGLTTVTARATLHGPAAWLEARGAGGHAQLGARDIPLLHEDLLLHSDALIDEAGILRGGPLGADLQNTRDKSARHSWGQHPRQYAVLRGLHRPWV